MLDIQTYLPARRKATTSGWVSFDAPCCTHNGESADRRQRGGIKTSATGWSYHCFNCGYTASFILGNHLMFRARRLLQWLGVPQEEIERINLESMRHRSITGILDDRRRLTDALQSVKFEDRDLPEHFIIADEHTPAVWEYLQQRHAPLDYPFGMLGQDPEAKWSQRPGVVVPFTYDGRIVGHTTRFLDDKTPKYIHDIQPGYVFGTDLQRPEWQHVLVMEGVFDALSVSGLAVLHADISDAQARVIRGLSRDITVVPDQDAAGMRLVDRALELGWAVSMPEWPEGCKDVNDAVGIMGRAATLITIMQARETSRIKIELHKRKLAKRTTP